MVLNSSLENEETTKEERQKQDVVTFIYLISLLDFMRSAHSLFTTMLLIKARLLTLLLFITQSLTQKIQSVMMTPMVGQQLQCANSTCSPFYTSIMSTSLNCQRACLFEARCQAVSFHALSATCSLFAIVPDPVRNMLLDVDTVTWITIDGTRVPPGQ